MQSSIINRNEQVNVKKANFLILCIILINACLPAMSETTVNASANNISKCKRLDGPNPNVTLDELMQLSTQNKQVQALYNLVEADKYVLKSNKQYFLPKIIASGTLAYSSTSTSSKVLEGDSYVSSYYVPRFIENTPGVVINQNVLNLAQQSQIASSSYQLVAQKNQTLAQAQSNALSSAQLYSSLLQYYNTAIAIKSIIKGYEIQYKNTLKLKKAGEASLIDLLSAKSQLELYQQELLQTKTSITTAISSLETLINTQVCPFNIERFASFPSLKEIPLPSESMINNAIELSPTLNAYKASASSSRYQAQYYQRNYLPSFSAQIGYSGTYENGNLAGVGNNSNQYYLGSELYGQLTFSWTIFDGGSNKSLAESQAETSKYNENLFKQSVIQLINNIQNNYQSDKLNTESLIKASSQLKINQSLTDLVSIGYRAGYMTYLNFQVQASSLYTAYSNLFSTQSTLVNNRLAFYSLYLFKDFEKTYSSLQNLSTPN